MLQLRIMLFSVLLYSLCSRVQAQHNLFNAATEVDPRSARIAGDFQLNEESLKRYELYKSSPLVSKIVLTEINGAALKDESLLINYGSKKTLATRSSLEERAVNDFSWFGKLDDETGTFFTVLDGNVISKFYLGNIPYTLLPLQGNVHMLIEYAPDKNIGYCLTDNLTIPQNTIKTNAVMGAEQEALAVPLPNDNTCNLRVLIAVTPTAERELGMNLDLVAQMLADESNLAYQQSQINFRMEIARVMRTSYSEVNTFQGSFTTDLVNFRNGAAPLNEVHTMRNAYQSDVQVLLRRGNFNTGSGILFGQAYEVPTGSANPNTNNAFCFIVTDYIIGGRFTFAHEIGHLQGARHDNHTATPTYARGFILNTTSGSIRSIMSTSNVVSCGTVSNGCRVQMFSNPNVTFNGNVMGTADRDNARRINETSNIVRNHRQTAENLVVQNETFDNEILANHLGNSTITTNGSVIALSGSRVTMRATDDIILSNGFEAQAGSNFVAVLNNSSPCSSLPPVARLGFVNAKMPQGNSNAKDIPAKKSNIAFYPNPHDNVLMLNVAGLFKNNTRLTYVITDLTGRILLNGIINNPLNVIKTHKIQAGTYFFSIYENGRLIETKKIIKN